MLRTFLFTAVLILLFPNCEPKADERKNVQGYSPADPEMNAAYNRARSTVGEFIAELKSPKVGFRYLVKIRVVAQGQAELVWIEPVQLENKVFRGPIANPLIKITSIKKGDVIEAKQQEISDWVILDETDTIVDGGYTQKVMMNHPGIKPE